jgi:hypothetical protein
MKTFCCFMLILGALGHARGDPPDNTPASVPAGAARFYGPLPSTSPCAPGNVVIRFNPLAAGSEGVFMAIAFKDSASLTLSLPGGELASQDRLCFGPATGSTAKFRAYVERRGPALAPGADSPVLVRILAGKQQKVILIEPVPGG